MTNFMDLLRSRWIQNKTSLCVGLDTDGTKLPESFAHSRHPLFDFNKDIIDATHDLVCSFKPQFAYYAAQGAEDQLQMTIEYIRKNYAEIPVILDSKRGDIGDTASMYAREAFERYQAHAVTVNPYMGGDTLQPYLKYKDHGVIVLCKTSNPGSGEIQDLQTDKGRVYSLVAEKAKNEWNGNRNVALVVGGTHLEELKSLRAQVSDIPFLVPGVGAQGGDLRQILKLGRDSQGQGLMINASRSIIYAGSGTNFQTEARKAAQQLVDVMRAT